MKKLVTAKTIEDFAANHGRVFQIGEDTLLTPSAKDAARSLDVQLVHVDDIEKCMCSESNLPNIEKAEGADACLVASQQEAANIDIDKEVIIAEIIKVLKEKGLLDKMAN